MMRSSSVCAARLRAAIAFAFVGANGGCPGQLEPVDEDTGGARAGVVTFTASFDPNTLCDRSEVVAIHIEATKVECVPGPPAPCTLPADPEPVVGDLVSCPQTDPTLTLGVEVDAVGRWAVALVGEATAGAPTERCLTPQDADAPYVEIDATTLDAGATIAMDPTEAPCP